MSGYEWWASVGVCKRCVVVSGGCVVVWGGVESSGCVVDSG